MTKSAGWPLAKVMNTVCTPVTAVMFAGTVRQLCQPPVLAMPKLPIGALDRDLPPATTTTPPPGNRNAYAVIQAESYNAQSGSVTESTTDIGGGQDLTTLVLQLLAEASQADVDCIEHDLD